MKTINTFDKMTVTVSCTEHEDIEMTETLQRFKDSAEVKKMTTEYYQPRLEAIGETKFKAIIEQLNSLWEIVKQVDEINGNNKLKSVTPLRTKYTRNDTGKTYRFVFAGSWNLYKGDIIDDFTNTSIPLTADKNHPYLLQLINDKDSWLAQWDEYNIYESLRSILMKRIQEFTATNINSKNALVDTYHEYVED